MVTRRKVSDGFGTFTKITFSGDDGEAFIEHLKDTAPEKRVERLEAYIARFTPSDDPIIRMRLEDIRRRVTRAKAFFDFALIELAEAAWRELEIYRVHMPRARQGAKQSAVNRKNAQQPRGKIVDEFGHVTTMHNIVKSIYVVDTPPDDLWMRLYGALDRLGLEPKEHTDTKGRKLIRYTGGHGQITFKRFEAILKKVEQEKSK